MFGSTAWSVVFTLVFAVTGGYALIRLARLLAGQGAAGDRLVELFHLLMSLAMIGMAWAITAGPPAPGGIAQLVVFGAFAVWFAYRVATRVTAHGRLANAYHLVMGLGMVWMIAVIPLVTGMSGDMEMTGHAGHDQDAGMSGMDPGAMVSPAPGWLTAVSIVLAVVLVLAAGWWTVRLARADDPLPEQDGLCGGGTATRAVPTVLIRTDAGCHVLMSIGMAGMLVAML